MEKNSYMELSLNIIIHIADLALHDIDFGNWNPHQKSEIQSHGLASLHLTPSLNSTRLPHHIILSATSTNLLRITLIFHPQFLLSSDQEEDVGSEVPRESKRPLTFASVVRDVMKALSTHEFLTKLEPFVRSVVQDEVERAIVLYHQSSPRSSLDLFESSQERPERAWQLHFDDKLPSTLFTSSRIESRDRKPVKVVILDAISKKIITSGPFSSIKIEIVVLDGDFGADDQEDWTEKEFNANVVREREGKRPLVTGELVISLRGGVGYIGDVNFTDNSSWIRSRRFRLGARPVQSISTEVRIREARSEAFVVKDHRGESYKKHHPPYLGDEIWRLERIAKDGAFHRRLALKGITTVKEFLQLYHVDQSSLRNILGGGISNKTWETIIVHATACVLDDKLYIYYRDAEGVRLVFNSIFKVVAATFDGQNYQPLDKLDAFQMQGLVENLKTCAYKNLNDLVPLVDTSTFGPAMLPSGLLADPYSSPSSSLQDVNFSGVQQDLLEMPLACNHMATSPPYIYNVEDGNQQEVSVVQQYQPLQVFTPTLRNSLMATNSYSGPYGGGNSWAPSGSSGPVLQIGHLTSDDNCPSEPTTWQGNGLFLASSNETVGNVSSNFGICDSRNGKPKARWCMIRAAIKWVISVRRVVAAKRRMARLRYLNF
ncbi:calmodulin-binding protein 60 G-like [Camellia sinensis]|uniref:calmodulin-binding protein 60 G-like n=1 Tax=Camellia sinensis TaxID=4442 RepID=UPI0010365909|nr:calmodulin-binding protein 60 G-like [Camellia sinensis]